jgi:hypothetical protein
MPSMASAAQLRLCEIARNEGFLRGNQVAETYFARAETDMELHRNQIIHPILEHIPYETALDIAAGRGRNSKACFPCQAYHLPGH